MTALARRKHAAAEGTRHCKKRPGLLCQRLEWRSALISAPQPTWPVTVLCAVWQVRRRGFYAYSQRQATARGEPDGLRRLPRVHAIQQATAHSDGRRRLAKPRQEEGLAVGRYHARRLMKPAGISVGRPTRRPVTTASRHGDAVAPNLWARQCAVEQPDKVWAGDITSLWTAAGWLSLATVLDLYARHVVGGAMSRRIAAAVVPEAWRLALGRRCPAAALMHHADRGRPYACGTDQARLADNSIRCRRSRQGDGLDNAVAERFLGSFKGARTSLRHDATRQKARDEVIDDIERFYNSRRKHSYLGYVSPHAFDKFAVVA
jgi:putative transposase